MYSKFLPTIALVGFLSGIAGGIVGVRWFQWRFQPATPVVEPTPQKLSATTPTSREGDETIAVVKKTSPSVVSILIRKQQTFSRVPQTPFDDFFEFPGFPFRITPQQPRPKKEGPSPEVVVGGGSGFIVSDDGMILTNKHVVSDDAAHYVVVTSDGKEHNSTVLARDPVNDLAIMKIDVKGLVPLPLGDSSTIQIGQTVIAIGNSLSEYRNTVTRGVISGVGRRVVAGSPTGESEVIEQAIQTDAAINPGNSGGPLLTLDGTVIGVNTAVNREGQSIGFSIPSNVAKQVVESVKKNGRIVRPWLGVRYSLIDEESAKRGQLPVNHGALIVRGNAPEELAVIPGSPADKAGIKENDILLEVNGTAITTEQPLAGLIAKHQPGDSITVKILRNGKEQTVNVTLAEYK